MSKSTISVGSAANDGTGDTLRAAGTKINNNFTELYDHLGSSGTLSAFVSFVDSGLDFIDSSFNNSLKTVNLTANRDIDLPDADGIVVLNTNTATLTNKTLTAPVISTISNTGTLTLPTSTDTLVGRDTTDTLANKTLNLPTLTNPTLNGDIFSTTFAVELLTFTQAGASAVNNFDISNANTGNKPILTGDGNDANISLNITGKGSGAVLINKPALDTNVQAASGNASTTKSFIIANSGSALAIDLTNGLIDGEIKVFVNKGAGIATITPTTFANGTSVALDQHDTATFIYHDDNNTWYLISHYGATVS